MEAMHAVLVRHETATSRVTSKVEHIKRVFVYTRDWQFVGIKASSTSNDPTNLLETDVRAPPPLYHQASDWFVVGLKSIELLHHGSLEELKVEEGNLTDLIGSHHDLRPCRSSCNQARLLRWKIIYTKLLAAQHVEGLQHWRPHV